MDKITQSIESLNRAKNGDSLANYQAIMQGFADKGIPHCVKVVTWIPAKDKDSESSFMLCRRSTVFHITQTDAIQ